VSEFGRKAAVDNSPVSSRRSRNGPLTILLIALLIILAIPALITLSLSFSLWNASQSITASVHKSLGRATLRNGVVSYENNAALTRMEERLIEMAAPAHVAPIHARQIHILALENHSSEPTTPDFTSVQTVTIDISRIGNWATVIIPEAPSHFEIIGAKTTDRAKIAVEGDLPFTLSGAHNGLLSGFRIRAFGAISPTSIRDLRRSNEKKYRRRFCRSVGRWMRHYDLQPLDVLVWQLLGAREITVWQRQVTSKNKKISFGGYASSVCRKILR